MLNIFNKIIGLMLIIFACAGMGYSKNQELKNHLKELENLKQAFYMLRGELQYTRATFEDVFEKIGDKIKGPIGEWLKSLCRRLYEKEHNSFEEIWDISIEQKLQESYLKKEDLNELKDIGKNLGYFENIDLFIEQLEYKIQKTREDCETKGKLYRSIGIMGGVFLVILLL